MIEAQWTYSKSKSLTKWYGHVDYFGPYVIGQWFVLDANTGEEYWSRNLRRPNSICGRHDNVLIASETRSDGPWTAGFGIYGIDIKTGDLLWTNHRSGIAGKILRGLDFIPGFTNGFRDAPQQIVGEHLYTQLGRWLACKTGEPVNTIRKPPPQSTEKTWAEQFYHAGKFRTNEGILKVEPGFEGFNLFCVDEKQNEKWHFNDREHDLYIDSNYYSFRLYGEHVLMVCGNAPKTIPVKPQTPHIHKNNLADYLLASINIATGRFQTHPLSDAKNLIEFRIESLNSGRLLISCDGKRLTEYRLSLS